MSKIKCETYIHDDVVGDMEYYIKYVDNILYPGRVEVVSDQYGKYIDIRTTRMTNEDDYHIFIMFDKNGKFIKGRTYFFISRSSDTTDQFEFKKKIKKEINMINNIHGATKNLIEFMGGGFSSGSAFR